MAAPEITIHDAGGVVIPEGTPVVLPTATPGTATAETVLSIRNNDDGGGAVDPLRNGRITVAARLAGSSDEPAADGLAFVLQRALQVRVSAVSGATSPITGWRPIGTGVSFSLGQIDDGGVVTIGVRVLAPLLASLSDVELFVVVEGLQSTPLPDGSYETLGNYVDDGFRGDAGDPDFTEVFSFAGVLQPDAPEDDSVDIWTFVSYVLAGAPSIFSPATPEVVFDATDGDAATLASGEAYYAALTLDGTDVINVTKGPKASTPLTDADRPTPPAGEYLAGWVQVPFGLVIDTVESVIELGFFGLEVISGLQVRIAGGRGAVGGRWVHSQTPTTLTLADDSTLEIYVTPDGSIEAVDVATGPTDGRSMRIWEITTAAGAVTAQVDQRRLGNPFRHPPLTRTTATTYICTATDTVVFANSTAASVTVNLPPGTSSRTIRVVNTGSAANQVSVDPDGGELLLGANSPFLLADGESLQVTYDTTGGWW